MTCRICGSYRLKSILNLGDQPWCNGFLSKEEIPNENKYPLEMMFCMGCDMLQLSHFVPKEVMFKNHSYVSGTTKTLKYHFLDIAKEKACFLEKDDLILDIGGNDGTQLMQYQSLGFNNVINVESADNIAAISRSNGVKTLNEFFNEASATTIKNTHGKAKLINAAGVFFHLEELDSVIKGIVNLLDDDGVFIVQFMYTGAMIDNHNYDTIYHEHLYYYTIDSLSSMLRRYGLNLFDCYYSEIHSGSIIASFSKNKREITSRSKGHILADKKFNLDTFVKFGKNVELNRGKLKKFITDLVMNGNKVCAFGAPAKGNTLLNYEGITSDLISSCLEVNEMKIGKYLPGSHIPIVREDTADYYLLLSHNFADEIKQKNPDKKFIVPFPEIHII